MLLSSLTLSWIFFEYYCHEYYCGYAYYCGLTRFSYFIFPECLRGWLDYPGHSILFSRPLVASLELTGGLSHHYSCGHPIGISLQVRPWRHLTPDWDFFILFSERHLGWLDYLWHSFALFLTSLIMTNMLYLLPYHFAIVMS
jgi:hypothetical protein